MYIIGITGIVAGGKSTFATELATALSASADGENTDNIQVVSTDNFLYPNSVLLERGLMKKKGFPQSHNVERLREFLTDVRQGLAENGVYSIPEYSHLQYNIIGTQNVTFSKDTNVLILEGVGLSEVTDLLNCLVFLDTPVEIAYERYIKRALSLRKEAKITQTGYFTQFLDLTDAAFIVRCEKVWTDVNLANYEQNILPLRGVADFVTRQKTPA